MLWGDRLSTTFNNTPQRKILPDFRSIPKVSQTQDVQSTVARNLFSQSNVISKGWELVSYIYTFP